MTVTNSFSNKTVVVVEYPIKEVIDICMRLNISTDVLLNGLTYQLGEILGLPMTNKRGYQSYCYFHVEKILMNYDDFIVNTMLDSEFFLPEEFILTIVKPFGRNRIGLYYEVFNG